MVTEDKDGICYQRVSLDDVLPGEEQLRRIEAIADPYAMQPQSIMEEQESRRELYDGLKRLTQRAVSYTHLNRARTGSECTSHYIRKNVLLDLVLEDMRRVCLLYTSRCV